MSRFSTVCQRKTSKSVAGAIPSCHGGKCTDADIAGYGCARSARNSILDFWLDELKLGYYKMTKIERTADERHAEAAARIAELEDLLFALGAMEQAPCFCCGYNGSGYFQPDKHPCAERHYRLKRD